MTRATAKRTTLAILVLAGATALASCTANSASSTKVAATETEALEAAPTVPGPPTVPASTTTVATTTTQAVDGPVVPGSDVVDTSVSTVPATTTTTVAHGLGVVTTTNEGLALPDDVASTATAIYQAAIRRDYDRLAFIIGDRKFRWGFVGERRPAQTWKEEWEAGTSDVIPLLVALLETRPGVDDKGTTVWPYLAVKDPKEWTPDDDAVAAALGFSPAHIADTKLKGRYLEYRVTISAEGTWTGFLLGA